MTDNMEPCLVFLTTTCLSLSPQFSKGNVDQYLCPWSELVNNKSKRVACAASINFDQKCFIFFGEQGKIQIILTILNFNFTYKVAGSQSLLLS